MPIEQAVTEVLDEAIRALAVLDLNKLERLEERIAALAASSSTDRGDGVGAGNASTGSMILAKRRLLELILQNCRSNLNALNRLHGRNTRDQWAH